MEKLSVYKAALKRAFEYSLDYLETLETRPVQATAPYAELKSRLEYPLMKQGMAADQVIKDLIQDAEGGVLGSAGGRFFGWVIGGSLPAALAADWITSAWDQNAASYAAGPAEAVIEEVVGKWLKDLLGLPAHASFAIVTGSQMAHATCLASARHGLMAKRGWDVERKGLTGAPQIRILTSDQFHSSVERAARFIGLGSDSIHTLGNDSCGRLQPDALTRALADEPDQPTIVLLQAGDLNIGAFDSFQKLIPIAHRFGAWVHVDGAFGLWTKASPLYSDLVKGIDEADSWVTDGHKWLNVPYDCGYAFVSHPDAHRGSMTISASYLIHSTEARDQKDWNPEWSRRGRGVATYAAIRQLGRTGIAELIERTCRHAKTLAERIGKIPGVEVVWKPQVNQGLVRFLDPNAGATNADHDRCTDETIRYIQNSGEVFFGGTTWQGKRCMRISVCNWLTDDSDIARSVAAVQLAIDKRRSENA